MLRRVTSKLRGLLGDERGNVLVLAAVGLPLVVGCVALAVDTMQWVYARRQLQGAADSAAIAGVYGIIQGRDMEVAVDDSLALRRDLDPQRSASAERFPEGHEEDPFAVRVRLAVPAKLSFSSLFLSTRPTIGAEAIATVVENGEFCAFAIGRDGETGLRIEPGSQVEAECGVATNSSSPEAIKADGFASLVAERIVAFGGIAADGLKSPARSFGPRQKDPLADTEPPLVPNTGCPNVTVNPGARASGGGRIEIEPGCYGNMVLKGSVRLRDGEYILNRGSLVVGPTAEVSCRACTIFLTSDSAGSDAWSIGKVRIDRHAKVQLSAPTEGPNAGILIYQDRHADGDRDRGENLIGGSSFSKLSGLIYFPSEALRIDGQMGPDIQCARFIGRRLIFQGRVLIAKGCSGSKVMNFRGTEVRLVG
jgi:hypothetical protein